MRKSELAAMAKVLAFEIENDRTETPEQLQKLVSLAESIANILVIEKWRRGQAALDAKKRREEMYTCA